MAKRNPHIEKLASGYLFPEITRRRTLYQSQNPEKKVISLGIGDTTEPLPKMIVEELSASAKALGTYEGYKGYGPEQGWRLLREKIVEKIYLNRFSSDEVFISDGINSDIGRLHLLFGPECTLSLQDPTYPAYIDTSVIHGRSLDFCTKAMQYKGVQYLSCNPENNFFPNFEKAYPTDLIYFCSPNNPTGAAATKEELKTLVDFARERRSIILFDAAYAAYIKDGKSPRSIYEIPGAEDVAIEMGSFSKMAGFTGVRLSWSVVPKTLKYSCGNLVHPDWDRVHCTFFNGASNLAQSGGLAYLTDEGFEEIKKLTDYYLENAALLKKALSKLGFEVYGGESAPFLWVKFPKMNSWDAFQFFLEKAGLVTAPGSGFGPAGEGFIRISAFGKRSDIIEAVNRFSLL